MELIYSRTRWWRCIELVVVQVRGIAFDDRPATAHFLAANKRSCSIDVQDGTVDLLLVPSGTGLPPSLVLTLQTPSGGSIHRRYHLDRLQSIIGRSGGFADPFIVISSALTNMVSVHGQH